MRQFNVDMGSEERLPGGPEDPRNFKFPDEQGGVTSRVETQSVGINAEEVPQQEAVAASNVVVGGIDAIGLPKEYEQEFREITEKHKKIEAAWDAIQDNKQFKTVLLYLTRSGIKDITQRDTLTINDVKEFYQNYPTPKEYAVLGLASRQELLKSIEAGSGPGKRAEYERILSQFARTMYPVE